MRLVLLAVLLCLAVPAALAEAASFSYIDLQGNQQSLERYRGKWVLLNLWATWCGPCMAEMPTLQALSEERNDLVVLGLAVDGKNPDRLQAFADRLHVTYPIIAGDPGMAERFEPRGFPTSILFNPKGDEVLHLEGPVTRQWLEAEIAKRP